MKITDVSSSTNQSDHSHSQDEDKSTSQPRRKRTLVEKYDIPIEQLDFDFVKKCNETQKIENILKILRSGQEGVFPDLERCTEERLEKLHPRSKLLRVEIPVIRTNELDLKEREEIKCGLAEWVNEIVNEDCSKSLKRETTTSEIFCSEKDFLDEVTLPIRGSCEHAATELHSRQHSSTSDGFAAKERIKSWEYDKWDKFDVDAELTKLDITDMQCQEWEKREKPKLIEEHKRVEKLMKESDDERGSRRVSNEPKDTVGAGYSQRRASSVDKESYIEEIDDDDDEAGTNVTTPFHSRGGGGSFRKTRITIDDLNLRI